MTDERRVLWFRRDLRLLDHPALLAAAADGAEVIPLYVLDERLISPAGPNRVAWVMASVKALADDLAEHGVTLVVRHGDPAKVLPELVEETGASEVHISSDHGPYGRERDDRVRSALGDVPLIETGSPYAVTPGRLATGDGTAYQVFSPYYRAWVAHGWRDPAESDPKKVSWASAPSEELPEVELPEGVRLEPGEAAARRHWADALDRVADYATARDRPDLDATSRISPYLKVGALHPRTVLADLAGHEGAEPFQRELAFRDFYADVLHHRPETAREYARPELRGLPYVTGDALLEHLDAWREGRTGFPLVDAGMRQLLAEGWMHNRVRMLVASFLVKDLGVEWTHGARHFMRHLIDGDLASNQHGWQWAAGSGTDAAPYFRVFNPTTQARKFDPDGTYIRRWIPELRDLSGKAIHEPWTAPDGLPEGYPEPIVDHAEARATTLEAYYALRDR
ncbi:deoxyribodipyrimidine photo-lyase [Nocardioides luteus]|uniref:Deoxyribodipyrimidine photo-lyase n=1 Tax=Nocardioides luteus TaxID=1844 RepID=A0ABQ5T4H0_9ACTN|nr:deoxyribodipyrimidine photo-lyase [Nocardioides luteus]MDR7313495.1 deoxyribodipyrimidine photo-lyase [Nocardioides luteus]GGR73212.1 deoxyribodipyrimidine photo-lyase [Nocardioides luteus]GLJ70036.1 deoxyribodipyrimidine photo-lyase [Nocardioides luteus]